jgi:hypothetical protein
VAVRAVLECRAEVAGAVCRRQADADVVESVPEPVSKIACDRRGHHASMIAADCASS